MATCSGMDQWAATLITPTAPTASSGSVKVSSPLYTSKPSGASAMTFAVSPGFAAASFTPTMLGICASSSSVGVLILRPVRIGMSYMMIGRSVHSATAAKCAAMPACEGRL